MLLLFFSVTPLYDKPRQYLTRGPFSRLSGVLVSVFATGPKSRSLKYIQGDGFLRAIKIRSTLSFGWEIKSEAPCRKILQHVKIICKRGIKWLQGKILTPFVHSSYLLPDDCFLVCQRALVDESGVFLCQHHHLTMVLPCSYIIWGMSNRPVGGCSSKTWSHPIDMIKGRGRLFWFV
jgi:hypothetical protein